MESEENVLIHTDSGVLHIGIYRPKKKNALTRSMYLAMAKALKDSVSDDSVKVVLIHGTQDAFSEEARERGMDQKRNVPNATLSARV